MPNSPAVNTSRRHWVVVGGGLGGIVAAYFLAKAGKPTVLIERGSSIGGVNSSHPWNGFTLDWGCHLFGNEADDVTAVFLDLMEHEIVSVTPRVASVVAGRLSPDLEYPDILSCGRNIAAAALYDLIEQAASPEAESPPRTLGELLGRRFGGTAARVLNDAFRKMLCESTDALAPEAFGALPANRVRVVSDGAADLLKQLPSLDARILRTSGSDPMRYHRASARNYAARAFYPATGGMGGFAYRAHARLEVLGCKVLAGTSIVGLDPETASVTLGDGTRLAAESIVWAAGGKALGELLGTPTPVDSGTHVVSMLLYYFAIAGDQAGPYSYIHDFDHEAPAFRISVPSNYAPSVSPPGYGYVCAEIATRIDSQNWANPDSLVDQVWDQAIQRGVLADTRAAAGYLVKKVPVTYRLPRPSLKQVMSPLTERIAQLPRLRLLDESIFSKSSNVRHVRSLCADLIE